MFSTHSLTLVKTVRRDPARNANLKVILSNEEKTITLVLFYILFDVQRRNLTITIYHAEQLVSEQQNLLRKEAEKDIRVPKSILSPILLYK